MKPVVSYQASDYDCPSHAYTDQRVIVHQGREGVSISSLTTRLSLEHHTLNEPCGSLACWLLPLEDLAAAAPQNGMRLHLGDAFSSYILLSDQADPHELVKGGFQVVWDSSWHPSFYAKFYQGSQYPGCFEPVDKAICIASHFAFWELSWYQLVVTWNRPESRYGLYVNGVLVAAENRFVLEADRKPLLASDPVADRLFIGHPAFAFGETLFFEQALTPGEVRDLFQASATHIDEDLQQHLRHVYQGEGNPALTWCPDQTWGERLFLPLNRASDLEHFYVQGNTRAPSLSSEGLRVTTPWKNQTVYTPPTEDHDQVYLWLKPMFEGDLYVELEFWPLRDGGLSLLMTQASGMQREDCLLEHPPRTNGSMRTVYGEDVRNYHWEYYREMNDVRNDLPSSALVKNPWFRPLAYGTQTQPIRKDGWNQLQWLQEGGRLRGAINGEVVVEAHDDGFQGSGPVLNKGHLALRCMVRSDILFRHLRVLTRPRFQVKPTPKEQL